MYYLYIYMYSVSYMSFDSVRWGARRDGWSVGEPRWGDGVGRFRRIWDDNLSLKMDFIWFYMILYGFVDDFPHLVDFWRDLLDVFSYFLLWRWCLLILGPSWDVTLGRADGVLSFKISRLHPRMSAMLVASAGANLVVSIIALHCLILTLCFITFP